jgi:hypothetical protein
MLWESDWADLWEHALGKCLEAPVRDHLWKPFLSDLFPFRDLLLLVFSVLSNFLLSDFLLFRPDSSASLPRLQFRSSGNQIFRGDCILKLFAFKLFALFENCCFQFFLLFFKLFAFRFFALRAWFLSFSSSAFISEFRESDCSKGLYFENVCFQIFGFFSKLVAFDIFCFFKLIPFRFFAPRA